MPSQQPATTTRILERLIELSECLLSPLPQRKNWSAKDCYQGPHDMESALATLREEFAAADLVAAGIISVNDDGSAGLHPRWSRAAGPLLILRSEPNQPPRDALIGPSKSLMGKIPIIAVLADGWTLGRMQKCDGMLFLCPTLQHVAAFRAMGLPAAPLSMITNLLPSGLRNLQRAIAHVAAPKTPQQKPKKKRILGVRVDGSCLELADDFFLGGTPQSANINVAQHLRGDYESIDREKEKNENDSAANGQSVTLVLVDWSPVDMEADQLALVRTTADFLAQTKRLLNLDVANALVWSPTNQEQNDLEFLLWRGEQQHMWEAIRDSVESSNYTPARFAGPDFQPRRPVETFGEAFLRIYESCWNDSDPQIDVETRRQMITDYHKLASRDLIAPLFQLASETKDPVKRVMLALVADSSSQYFGQVPAMLELFSAGNEGADSIADNASLLQKIGQRLGIAAKFNRLLKEIRQ